MRWHGPVLILLHWGTTAVHAQVLALPSPGTSTNTTQSSAALPASTAWSFSASLEAYFPGDSQNFLQPTVSGDREWLHLEARYNNEALGTGSAWIGYNFSTGEQVHLDFTAMVGGIFGQTRGYAPGYEFTLSWRRFQLYSEAEYVVDTGNSADSYVYTWSEFTVAPTAWFQGGLVIQRTRAYHTDLDIQRGILVRYTRTHLDVSGYVLNPDESKPTFILGTSVTF